MSNIKEILIEGKLPFNLDHDPELERLIGQLNAPSLSIDFDWGNDQYFPNKDGGSTSMYRYTLQGEEAFSSSFIEYIVRTFSKHGPVSMAGFRDVENSTSWFNCKDWITDEWKKNFIL